MFKALLLEKDDAGFRAAVKTCRRGAALPEGDVSCASSTRRSTTRTRLAITNRSPVVRALADGRRHRRRGHGARVDAMPSWKPGDVVVPQRLGRGRDALGLPGRARAPEGRLAGARCRPRFTTRQAMAIGTAGYTAMLSRARARAPRRARPATASARHRRDRRRRQRRRRAARAPRPPRRRLHRQGDEAAYLQRARRRRCDRPRRARRARQAAAEGALGGGDRCGRQPHARQRAARRPATAASSPPAASPRGTTCRHGDAVHPARRDAGRHRQRHGAARARRRRRGSGSRATSIRRRST